MQMEWATVQIIAGLPGVNETPDGVRRQATRENWKKQKRAKGKGFEYHISSLPPETQRALKISATKKQQAQSQQLATLNSAIVKGSEVSSQQAEQQKSRKLKNALAFSELSPKEQSRIRARSEVLAAWEVYITDFGKIEAATRAFLADFNNGQFDFSADVKTFVPKLSRSSLMRWRSAYAEHGPAGLACGYKATKQSVVSSQPELLAFAEGVLANMPHTKPGNMLALMEGEFDQRADIQLPSHRTLIGWLAKWKAENARLFTAVANPDAYKNKYMVAAGDRRENIVRLHQRWELDSSPADVMCTDGRFSLIACVDVYSASALMMVRQSSDSYGIALTLRQAILQWGMSNDPEREWGVDNGQDYASHFIRGVADSLGVKLAYTDPFAGEQKPFVERFFRSFSHHLTEQLPGFVGHNVAERKAIEAQFSFADRLKRKSGSSKNEIDVQMSSTELQKFVNDWLYLYMHKPHEGLDGATPAQMVQNWMEPLQRIENERVLDLLLEPIPGNKGQRTIQKKGIKLDNSWFIGMELGARVGDRVQVRYDKADVGRIYVFELDGGFIGMAQNPRITGVSHQELAIAMKNEEKRTVGKAKKALKAKGRKIDRMAAVEKALAAKRRKIDEELANVTPLPKPSHSLSTDYIDGAVEALTERDQLIAEEQEEEMSPEKEVAMAQFVNKTKSSAPAQVKKEAEDGHARFRRWHRLEERVKAGETLSEFEQRWKTHHETTAEWQGHMLVYEDFGIEMFGKD